jgi:glutathione S-transferase
MMKLHWSPRSPYVRKVMIAAGELGLQDRLECVRTVVGGTKPHLELMQVNPLGKIPTLELEDGRVLYDSFVLIAYLDTLHVGPKLIPVESGAYFTALRRHALGNGMLDVGLASLGERFRPTERQSAPHLELWRLKLRTCLHALEQEAEALARDPFGIGHLAIGVALGYLDFRFDIEKWREGHPKLAAWHATFNARPSVVANPPVDDW